MKVDYLIVGAGFSGSVLAERIANELNKKVLIVDRRNHIGGNAYDFYDENGILVHRYGPHIFHTNSKKVWDYLSRFTQWRIYYHKVLAVVEGKKIPVPFNLNSLYLIFPPKYAEKCEKLLIETYGYGTKIPILKMLENSQKELKELANFIYENIFLGYNLKQWGLKPEELDPSVTARVPVFISRDDRYFQDKYQGIPSQGYTKMFENMLNHPNISILLNVDYKEIIEDVKFDRMIYTGPIDYFFDYIYGALPYRSLKFEFKTLSQEFYQEVAQVNYPNDYDFTRITEFKHMTGQKLDKTTIAFEYPETYRPEENEPYYPVPKDENLEIYSKYTKEVKKLSNIVHFVGRLADYKYYNMDQIVARALNVFEKEICNVYA